MTKQDELEYWSMMDRLTGAIALRLHEVGFALVDGKMECIMGEGRRKMIGDVFGTPDEDRFCQITSLSSGQVVHYSKEFLRQLFIENGYYEKLKTARKNKKPDPPWTLLTEEQLQEAGRRYKVVAEAYSG
jgi:phosphoribosylaminoimidazole-succinocarboxamide synthase